MTTRNIRISVLLTYFNEGRLLTDTLRSLSVGSSPPDEILIYDDASTVRPEPFLVDGLPVRVIRGEKNIGPSRGRNRLLAEASCDYVHFHDSDDWFHPSWCHVVRAILQDSAVDVALTELSSSVTGHPDYSTPFMGFVALAPNSDLVPYALVGCLLTHSTTIRRTSAVAIGGFREELHQSEDKDFSLRLAASGITWSLDPRPLVCIRNRQDSRSKREVEVWNDGLKCLEYARVELPARYSRHIANAAARCATKLFSLGERESARRALRLAAEAGGADYDWRSKPFRWIARNVTPEAAEWLSRRYLALKA